MTPSKEEARELAPCPICGKQPWSVPQNGYLEAKEAPSGFYVHVHCGCGAQGPERLTDAEAVEAWNTRATLPPQHSSRRQAICTVCSQVIDVFDPHDCPGEQPQHSSGDARTWLARELEAEGRKHIAARIINEGECGATDIAAAALRAIEAARSRQDRPEGVEEILEALHEQTGLVELLCDIVDCVAEDVGHGTGKSADDVLRLLGPCNDRAIAVLTKHGMAPDRGAALGSQDRPEWAGLLELPPEAKAELAADRAAMAAGERKTTLIGSQDRPTPDDEELAPCEHRFVNDGPDVSLLYGSATTEVCCSCYSWRLVQGDRKGQWRDAVTLASEFADPEMAHEALAASPSAPNDSLCCPQCGGPTMFTGPGGQGALCSFECADASALSGERVE